MIHKLLPHRTRSAMIRLQQPSIRWFSLSATKASASVYRDMTIFNDGTHTPPSDKLLCITQGSSLVMHMIADCRNKNNTTTTTFNVKHNRDINMFAHPDGEESNIVDQLAESLEIPHTRAKDLVELGAVYLSPFPPRKGVMGGENMRHLKPEQKSLLRRCQKYVEKVFDDVKPPQFLFSPKRVLDPSIMVKTGSYIKTTMHPRRVPVAMSMTSEDWRKRIVYEDNAIVVVDKPSCIPTTPTADNAHDNMAAAVGLTLGYTEVPRQMYIDKAVPRVPARRLYAEVFPYVPKLATGWTEYCTMKYEEARIMSEQSKDNKQTHGEEIRTGQLIHTPQRLDHGSSGCVIMTKTKDASSRVQKCLTKNESIRTIYKVLCFSFTNPCNESAPSLPLGELTHYLATGPSSPTQPLPLRSTAFNQPAPALKEAKLIVLNVSPVVIGNNNNNNNNSESPQSPVVQLWEIDLELLTGRPHQIRAQIEAFGLCVVGDEIYPRILWASDEDKSTHEHAALLDGRIGIHVNRVEINLGVVYGPVATQDVVNPSANKSEIDGGDGRLRGVTSDVNGSIGGDGGLRDMVSDSNGSIGGSDNNQVKVVAAGEPWWRLQAPEEVWCIVDTQLTLLRRQNVD